MCLPFWIWNVKHLKILWTFWTFWTHCTFWTFWTFLKLWTICTIWTLRTDNLDTFDHYDHFVCFDHFWSVCSVYNKLWKIEKIESYTPMHKFCGCYFADFFSTFIQFFCLFALAWPHLTKLQPPEHILFLFDQIWYQITKIWPFLIIFKNF